MKKSYIIPSSEVVNFELNCMVCATSPSSGREIIENGNNLTVTDPDDAPILDPDDEFDARQRGGDFGSLW